MSDIVHIELAESVRREIEKAALTKGVSPEEFIAAAAAEKAGAVASAAAYFAARAARAQSGSFAQVFGSDRPGGNEAPSQDDQCPI